MTREIDHKWRVPPGDRLDPLPDLINQVRKRSTSLKKSGDLEIVVEALTRLVNQSAAKQ